MLLVKPPGASAAADKGSGTTTLFSLATLPLGGIGNWFFDLFGGSISALAAYTVAVGIRAQSGVEGIIKLFHRLFATDRVMATASELEDVEAELRSCKSGCPPAEKLSRYLKIVSPFMPCV
jgi:hypothetical protein